MKKLMVGIKIKIIPGKYSKLSTCKWCGYPFVKKHNREMYCTDEHKQFSRQKQKRDWWSKQYQAFPEHYNSKKKGTGWLGAHMHNDEGLEMKRVQAEMKRLKLKSY